jgi:NADH-quinone oxidoreductase subunit L
MDEETRHHVHESPWVVWLPLVVLAVPSVAIGWLTIDPVVFGGFFGDAIFVRAANDVVGAAAREYHGPVAYILHAFGTPIPYLAAAGAAVAWYLTLRNPAAADSLQRALRLPNLVLENKYWFDAFNEKVLAAGSRLLGTILWRGADTAVIDGALVNGSARLVGLAAGFVRRAQTGYLYDYAFVMIIGLATLLGWLLWRSLG